MSSFLLSLLVRHAVSYLTTPWQLLYLLCLVSAFSRFPLPVSSSLGGSAVETGTGGCICPFLAGRGDRRLGCDTAMTNVSRKLRRPCEMRFWRETEFVHALNSADVDHISSDSFWSRTTKDFPRPFPGHIDP
jgi:hypothetical protein